MAEPGDSPLFARRGSAQQVEAADAFSPAFDKDGLIPAIVTDGGSGGVLMFAWMNAEALELTLSSGIAHFWSRSRAKLWRKGEESGNQLRVAEILTDCDQDVVWLRVDVEGNGVACHTGRRSCFYRRLEPDTGARPVRLLPVEPDT